MFQLRYNTVVSQLFWQNWKFDLKYMEKWKEKGQPCYNLPKKIWKDIEKVYGKTF